MFIEEIDKAECTLMTEDSIYADLAIRVYDKKIGGHDTKQALQARYCPVYGYASAAQAMRKHLKSGKHKINSALAIDRIWKASLDSSSSRRRGFPSEALCQAFCARPSPYEQPECLRAARLGRGAQE